MKENMSLDEAEWIDLKDESYFKQKYDHIFLRYQLTCKKITNRQQIVLMSVFNSECSNILCGIQQGLVLKPKLFTMH